MARRFGLMITGTLVALFFIGGAASAQQYPVQESTLQTNKTEVRPGEPITVSGEGFAPNTTVTITFDDAVVLGTTQTRPDGTFSTTVTIPANASPGTHTITATGTAANGGTRRLTTTVRVLGTAAAAPGGTLPRTGTGITAPLAASAGLLIAAGVVAVTATRRRRLA